MSESFTFSDDVSFLTEHTDVITLHNSDGAAVVVAPAWQGRVMTSSYDAQAGPSFGWINRKLIPGGVRSPEEAKGTLEEKIHVFGGEERFWLGPEGGQFSYYFAPGAEFEFENWFTPAIIDTIAFEVLEQSDSHALCRQSAELVNQSGHLFKMGLTRRVDLLSKEVIEKNLEVSLSDAVQAVAYQTDNQITNQGDEEWTPETGMPSVWMLGMYAPSPTTTIVIPIKDGEGEKVNDKYFGAIPDDYLRMTDSHIFMKGDGTRRGKIGVTPERSLDIAASYDANGKVLTIVTCTPQPAPHGYVNAMWEYQEDPFSGDVINAYNDGSPEPGAPPLGPFYELETSSPAAALKPEETLSHKQQTYHLHASEEVLDQLAQQLIGVSLSEIQSVFAG